MFVVSALGKQRQVHSWDLLTSQASLFVEFQGRERQSQKGEEQNMRNNI